MKYVRGDLCGFENCPSKQYYLLDGRWYCRYCGHRNEGRVQIQQDEDDIARGRRARRKSEEREHVSKISGGKEAFELLLQCYQLILWKQVHWLVHEKGFPTQIEGVIRDLWALRLQLLRRKAESSSGFESSQTYYTSTSDESGSGLEYDRVRSRKKRPSPEIPALFETLALCYIGTLLLRLPVSIGDFHRWAEGDEIAYTRATRFLPQDMKSRLRGEYYTSLNIGSILEAGELQQTVYEMVNMLHDKMDMSFPAPNSPLLLFKYIKELSLPLETLSAASEILKLLGLSVKYRHVPYRQGFLEAPETQLMSCLVVAVKVSQPFEHALNDTEDRNERSDRAHLGIDWEAWQNVRSNVPSRRAEHLSVGRAGKENRTTEADVFNMESNQLDRYMDWYAKTWIDKDQQRLPDAILDFFPVERTPQRDTTEVPQGTEDQQIQDVRNVMASSRSRTARQFGKLGSEYKRYRKPADLIPQAQAFFTAAAEVIAIKQETLVRAVFKTETKLDAVAREAKKRG